MCGIAGHVDFRSGASADHVRTQLETLVHRGPDSVGATVNGPAAIGQTRLAVIDLETGDPPIVETSGRFAVAQNGEIYNFRELRSRLLDEGVVLRTTGDTEVIAAMALRRDGPDLARVLDGMFAVALWDERDERLTLVRDRVGKKPLYYWTDGPRLVFGSEIKAVLAHPAVPDEIDPSVVPAYLNLGYVPSPRTFYRGIVAVPAGHVLQFDATGVHLAKYWDPPLGRNRDESGLGLDFRSAAGRVRHELEAAIARRLVSDVPLGAFLSGGIDSSAVVAITASLVDRPVRTFTIGFGDDQGFDERPFATAVAERFGTDHTEFVVEPDAVDLVERLVWHHDQPFGDSSAVPTFFLSQLTKQHVTVALSGDGGDELFAGYERFAAGTALARVSGLPGPVGRGIARTLRRAASMTGDRGHKIDRFAAKLSRGMPDGYRAWISYLDDDLVDELTGTPDQWWRDEYRAIWAASAGAPPLERLLDLNFRTYLADDLLPKVDRMAMAHGLEVRSPFLDPALIALAGSLPSGFKQRGLDLKRVLKAAVADLLPREITHRPKHGFGVPLDRWFRDDLRTYTESMLLSDRAHLAEFVDRDVLRRLLQEHGSGRTSFGHALWTLLTLEVFLRARR